MQLDYMSNSKTLMEKVNSLNLGSIWPKKEKIIWRKDRRRMYKFLSPRNASHTKMKPAEARFN